MVTKSQALSPMLTARQCAELAGCGEATWWRRDAAATCPKAIRHGRVTRWRRTDVELWLELGCPNRERFESLKRARQGA